MAGGTHLRAALCLLVFCVGCSVGTPQADPAPTVTVVAVEQVTEQVTVVETEYVTEVPAPVRSRPDEAAVNQFTKSIWRCYLDREPRDWELADARQAFFGFWEANRDAWAATVEWFEDRYTDEIDMRMRIENEAAVDCQLVRDD